MRSEPTRKELLISIRSFLEDLNLEVFPNVKNEIVQFINDDLISNLTGHNRFYAFVARNSLQIIQREINLINGYEEKEIIRLEKLLNEKGDIKDLNKILCKRITDKELEAKKTTINGLFNVSLDTTSGLVDKVLTNAEKRRDISYLDEYQELIKGLEKNKINDSIQSNIDTNLLSVTIAGS